MATDEKVEGELLMDASVMGSEQRIDYRLEAGEAKLIRFFKGEEA